MFDVLLADKDETLSGLGARKHEEPPLIHILEHTLPCPRFSDDVMLRPFLQRPPATLARTRLEVSEAQRLLASCSVS